MDFSRAILRLYLYNHCCRIIHYANQHFNDYGCCNLWLKYFVALGQKNACKKLEKCEVQSRTPFEFQSSTQRKSSKGRILTMSDETKSPDRQSRVPAHLEQQPTPNTQASTNNRTPFRAPASVRPRADLGRTSAAKRDYGMVMGTPM